MLLKGFSQPSVHNLVYKDDFYRHALKVRNELLMHPSWLEMQSSYDARPSFAPGLQNGRCWSRLMEELLTGHCWKAAT